MTAAKAVYGRAAARELFVAFTLFVAACAGTGNTEPPRPAAPLSAVIQRITPQTVVPRSRLSLEVTNVTLQAEHTLYIEGLLDGGRTVQLQLPVTVEKGTLYAETGDLLIQQGEGRLTGKAWLVSSNQYGNTKGAESSLNLEIRRELTPSIDSIGEGIVFLNSQVVVNARNLMLGGKEGSTKAELSGCFIVGVTSRTQCEPGDKQVRVEVAVSAQSRSRGSFAFVVENRRDRPRPVHRQRNARQLPNRGLADQERESRRRLRPARVEDLRLRSARSIYRSVSRCAR
jgi:hypothetical protein